jgi:hypothetical protein
MMLLRLSALRTGCHYPTGSIPGTHFCWKSSRPQGHSTAGRIMSVKNSNDTIGYRAGELPACRVVPEATVTPRAPVKSVWRGGLK